MMEQFHAAVHVGYIRTHGKSGTRGAAHAGLKELGLMGGEDNMGARDINKGDISIHLWIE